MAQIAALLEGADERQPLSGQPAVAGQPPLDHQAAPHLGERVAHPGQVGERQAIRGDVWHECGGGVGRRRRREQRCDQAEDAQPGHQACLSIDAVAHGGMPHAHRVGKTTSRPVGSEVMAAIVLVTRRLPQAVEDRTGCAATTRRASIPTTARTAPTNWSGAAPARQRS
jgi:hypothetical protein